MFWNKRLACFLSALMLLVFTNQALAQMIPSKLAPAVNYSGFQGTENYYFSLGLRKYINSFTSFEFLDPDHTFVDPASRLEWPWEQMYGVVKTGLNNRGLQVNLEFASTALTPSGLKAQDSDWDNISLPNQKTIFSEAEAKPRGWTFDASLGFDLPVIDAVRWIIGYRAQQFRFTYTDMSEKLFFKPQQNGFSDGEVIQFTQDYKYYYAGAVIGTWLDMTKISYYFSGTSIGLRLLGDIGYVTANNLDFHVLRLPAPRYTFEATEGLSWRLNLALDGRVTDWIKAGVAGEFMRIRTGGSHRWKHPAGLDEDGVYQNAVDQTWKGARVWSDQKFIEIYASMSF
ncbi:MAG: hypothetical protein AB7V04_10765 [Desulfomonilaceae bacterium]